MAQSFWIDAKKAIPRAKESVLVSARDWDTPCVAYLDIMMQGNHEAVIVWIEDATGRPIGLDEVDFWARLPSTPTT